GLATSSQILHTSRTETKLLKSADIFWLQVFTKYQEGCCSFYSVFFLLSTVDPTSNDSFSYKCLAPRLATSS
ncbi:Uncharacterized protein APZ42_003537, partial [Daphnia magna]